MSGDTDVKVDRQKWEYIYNELTYAIHRAGLLRARLPANHRQQAEVENITDSLTAIRLALYGDPE